MGGDWAAINQIVDAVLIALGIGVLIVRQFLWRTAQLSRMLRMPALVIAMGLVYLVVELRSGFHWVAADWLVVAELAMVAITGTMMGYATRFRVKSGRLQYRLTGIGVLLWAVFVAVRVANFALAGALGADLGEATGLILLSFGINRLAAILIVRYRATSIVTEAVPDDAPIEAAPAENRRG